MVQECGAPGNTGESLIEDGLGGEGISKEGEGRRAGGVKVKEGSWEEGKLRREGKKKADVAKREGWESVGGKEGGGGVGKGLLPGRCAFPHTSGDNP